MVKVSIVRIVSINIYLGTEMVDENGMIDDSSMLDDSSILDENSIY